MNIHKTRNDVDKYPTVVTIFLTFLAGCVIGWIYEMCFYRIDMGYFIKRGQGFGPWLPIYGVGSLAITLLFYKHKDSPAIVLSGSVVATGTIEFITGWALFHFGNGLRLWDYNVEIWNWGNIGGYVCLRSVMLFGISGLLLVYILIPIIGRCVLEIRREILTPLVMILAILFTTDIVFGYFIRPFLI